MLQYTESTVCDGDFHRDCVCCYVVRYEKQDQTIIGTTIAANVLGAAHSHDARLGVTFNFVDESRVGDSVVPQGGTRGAHARQHPLGASEARVVDE